VTTPRLHASSLCAIVGWAIVWSAGCGDIVAQPIGESMDGAADDASDAAPGPDAPASFEGGLLDGSAFCQGHGPIPLPGDAGQRCTADLSHLFRFALCACQSLDASGTLTTDSFDLSSEAGAGNVHSASIASNGEVSTNAQTTIGGSIYAAGQNIGAVPAVTLRGGGTILGDVQASGDVHVGGPYQVHQDVDTSGNVVLDPGGSLSVLGQLNLPAGNSATGVMAVNGIHNAAVSVRPPCDCSNPIDVASIVAAHQTDNDDAARGLSRGALVQPPGPVALSCGRYFVNGIQGGTIALDVTGRVALFVQGDLSITGRLAINLSPGAELDLFVSGNVLLMGMATFGAPNSPAHVRLYVGGTSFELAASVTVGVNAYAPNAVVALASSLEMWGALFAKALQFSGNFAIHYDSSVLTAEGCAPSGGSCKTCDDCAGATPACKGGTCVPCVTTADCCAPLVCSTGRCVLGAQ
jgi:hypothetical protein